MKTTQDSFEIQRIVIHSAVFDVHTQEEIRFQCNLIIESYSFFSFSIKSRFSYFLFASQKPVDMHKRQKSATRVQFPLWALVVYLLPFLNSAEPRQLVFCNIPNNLFTACFHSRVCEKKQNCKRWNYCGLFFMLLREDSKEKLLLQGLRLFGSSDGYNCKITVKGYTKRVHVTSIKLKDKDLRRTIR